MVEAQAVDHMLPESHEGEKTKMRPPACLAVSCSFASRSPAVRVAPMCAVEGWC